MKQSDLYWSVYRNLEDEVLNIAKYIHCDSSQKSVYSMAIADLIVRCAVEIEAISKVIYKSLGGDMEPKDAEGNDRYLFFDTDCEGLLPDGQEHGGVRKVPGAAFSRMGDKVHRDRGHVRFRKDERPYG